MAEPDHEPGVEADGGGRTRPPQGEVDGNLTVTPATVSHQGQQPVAPGSGVIEAVSQGARLALGPTGCGGGDDMQHERVGRSCFPHESAPFSVDITTAGEEPGYRL
jgi:hypothetical protein